MVSISVYLDFSIPQYKYWIIYKLLSEIYKTRGILKLYSLREVYWNRTRVYSILNFKSLLIRYTEIVLGILNFKQLVYWNSEVVHTSVYWFFSALGARILCYLHGYTEIFRPRFARKERYTRKISALRAEVYWKILLAPRGPRTTLNGVSVSHALTIIVRNTNT